MTIIFNLLNIRCLEDVVMPDAEIAGAESSQFYEIRIESDTKKACSTFAEHAFF